MAWSHTVVPTTETKVLTVEDLLKKETHWESAYNEPETWIKDLKVSHYALIGEYEVDKTHRLYRFELDETKRKELRDNAPHFQNVLVDISLPQIKLGNSFTEKEVPKPVVVEVKVDACETCKRPFDKGKK